MIDWFTCVAVERDTQRMSGMWVFKNTRVPIAALFENLYAAGGGGVETDGGGDGGGLGFLLFLRKFFVKIFSSPNSKKCYFIPIKI